MSGALIRIDTVIVRIHLNKYPAKSKLCFMNVLFIMEGRKGHNSVLLF